MRRGDTEEAAPVDSEEAATESPRHREINNLCVSVALWPIFSVSPWPIALCLAGRVAFRHSLLILPYDANSEHSKARFFGVARSTA